MFLLKFKLQNSGYYTGFVSLYYKGGSGSNECDSLSGSTSVWHYVSLQVAVTSGCCPFALQMQNISHLNLGL